MPDESARARERWVVVNVRAFGVAQIAPSERERERHSYIGKRDLNPAYLGPPRRFGAHFISFQIPKSYAIITQRVIALLSQSVLSRVVLLPMRGGAPRTQEREKRENPIFLVSFFFFLNFFPLFCVQFSVVTFIIFCHFSPLSLSLSLRETKLME